MNPPITFNSGINDDNPVSYKGNRPYIFISYAHADRSRVLPIIVRLQKDGFRVWYDEGIDPGTEWDEFIASAIDKCGYFFAFISRNYQLSENCKDEMSYVRDLKPPKNRLLIYLENVSLDKGMKLRQSRLQAVHLYNYTSQEKIYERIYSTVGLNKCHENGRIPSVQTPSENTPVQNPLYNPRAVRSGQQSSPINMKKIAIVAVAVVLVLFVFKTAVSRLTGQDNQDVGFSNDFVENDNMVDTYDDNYGEDDVNNDESNINDTASEKQDTVSSKDRVKLTSIEEPVENNGFCIKENASNTMGTTYDKAVCISDPNRAYVRYNVGDFNRFTGTYSIDNEGNLSGKEFKLQVYLDENEDAPYIDTSVSRSTVETPIDIDVSSAQFITFVIEEDGSFTGCSLLLTDCYLSKESSPAGGEAEVKSTGTSISTEKSTVKLTSIEEPVENNGFCIKEKAANTMGTTYDKAVCISDPNRAYVRYNVGDFNRFAGTYSIDNEGNPSGKEFKLQVYLDENEDAPYIDTIVSRSTVETQIDIDVSSAQFITFVIEEDGSFTGCSLLLTDCTLSK